MKEKIKIENWFLTTSGDPYTAPEMRIECIAGEVYNHPNFKDGSKIITSPIERIEGRKIFTRSSVYLLGKIQPEYRKWIKDNGYSYDPKNPIKDKRK